MDRQALQRTMQAMLDEPMLDPCVRGEHTVPLRHNRCIACGATPPSTSQHKTDGRRSEGTALTLHLRKGIARPRSDSPAL